MLKRPKTLYKRPPAKFLKHEFLNKRSFVVVVFALVGGLIIILSHAATPTANIEPENGNTNTATTVSDSNASNGKYVKFAKAAAPTGWPDATNTGYQHATQCPNGLSSTYSGTSVTASNQTFNCVDFPSGVRISADNITFNGCRFTASPLYGVPQSQWNNGFDGVVSIDGNNITFNYATFAPKPSVVSAPPVPHAKGYEYGIVSNVTGALTVNHVDFWGWSNAIQIGGSDQTHPVTIKNSWFHDYRTDGTEVGLSDTTTPTSDHTDGILENWGDGGHFPEKYITIDHNHIAGDGNTNALGLQDGNGGGYDHSTITNNYFSGFNVTVDLGHSKNTNTRFIGNVYGSDYRTDHIVPGDPNNSWSQSLLYGNNGNNLYESAKGDANNIWCDNKYHPVSGGEWAPFPPDGSYWWIIDNHWSDPLPGTPGGVAAHTTDDPHFSGTCPAHPISN